MTSLHYSEHSMNVQCVNKERKLSNTVNIEMSSVSTPAHAFTFLSPDPPQNHLATCRESGVDPMMGLLLSLASFTLPTLSLPKTSMRRLSSTLLKTSSLGELSPRDLPPGLEVPLSSLKSTAYNVELVDCVLHPRRGMG